MRRWEITKREIIVSISIIALMLVAGVFVSGKISEYRMDKNEIYNKAAKIESLEMFQYGIRTNIGNAFAYGDLEALDPVTYPEIGNAYMYVEKVKEEYIMHSMVVTATGAKGSTHTRTQIYWSWDVTDRENVKCKKISFLGCTFDSDKIKMPGTTYIGVVSQSSTVRYKYYGIAPKLTGTIFTKIENQTISDNTKFYNGKTIDETVRSLKRNWWKLVFWVFWILLICGCVGVFCYFDNHWLD